jgi:transposase
LKQNPLTVSTSRLLYLGLHSEFGIADADERVIKVLEEKGIVPVIPSKSNRKEPRPYDTFLYKARHLVENFFAKLKQYRALATRYDKRSANFLGGICLAASVIWLA